MIQINEVEANCIYRLLMIDNIGNYFYSNSANVPLTENDVLQYYPNPAKNFLNICLNKDSQELETIVIKNYLGTIVFKDVKHLNSGVNNIQLNISILKAGNYILSVMGNNCREITAPFIKL